MTTTKIDSKSVVDACQKEMEDYEEWAPKRYPLMKLEDIKGGEGVWYRLEALHELASKSVNGMVEIDKEDFDLIKSHMPKPEPPKPKGTTPDQIRFAYGSTLQCSNGHSIEDCLKDDNKMKLGTVCDILKYLNLEENPFGSHIVLNNPKVGMFYVTYKFCEFTLIITEFHSLKTIPFSTVGGFADWLNECERKVLEASESLKEEKDE